MRWERNEANDAQDRWTDVPFWNGEKWVPSPKYELSERVEIVEGIDFRGRDGEREDGSRCDCEMTNPTETRFERWRMW